MIAVRLIAASLSISAAMGVNAATSFFGTSVGDRSLTLPIPDGFSEPSVEAPIFRSRAEWMTVPQMRLLAVYVEDSDVRAVKEGTAVAFRRYFMVSVLRSKESDALDPEAFKAVKSQVRGVDQEVSERAQANVQAQLRLTAREIRKESNLADFGLKIGQSQQLGVTDETESSITTLSITRTSATNGTREISALMGLATSLVLVEGKVVILAAYSKLESDEDYQWLRHQNASWIRATVQATSK